MESHSVNLSAISRQSWRTDNWVFSTAPMHRLLKKRPNAPVECPHARSQAYQRETIETVKQNEYEFFYRHACI